MTSSTDDTSATIPPGRRRRRGRLGLWTVAALLGVAALLLLAALSLTERALVLPGWAESRIEARIAAGLAPGTAGIGTAELTIGRDGTPHLTIRDVAVRDGTGAEVAHLNEVSARFDPLALIGGRAVPAELNIAGAQITLRRDAEGRVTVSFGAAGAASGGSLAEVMGAVDTAFIDTPMAGLARLEGRDLTITLEDARSGRVWQASNATLHLEQDDALLSISVGSEVFNGTDELADIQLSFRKNRATGLAELAANLGNAAAADIALQSPALSYLEVLDAPISGAVRASVAADGALQQLAATLDVGAGALSPTQGAAPVGFESGRLYLTYDPDTQRIDFSEVSVEAAGLTALADGHAYLRDLGRDGWPETLLGQLRLSEARLLPGDVFEAPVALSGGQADLRLRLDPFTLSIGQAAFALEDRRVRLTGEIAAEREGWRVAIDAAADEARPQDVLALWPLPSIPGTRRWVAANVRSGTLLDLSAAVRIAPGQTPRVAVGYDFRDAEVRVMRHLPPITGGAGRASLIGHRYAMVLSAGRMEDGAGGAVDLTGSTFTVPDVRPKPARAEVLLQTSGALPSLLRVLDHKPFELLQRSGQPADLAEAAVTAETKLGFDLLQEIRFEDVSFATQGTLLDLRTDGLVPGRSLEAGEVVLSVDGEGLQLTGAGRLDGMPLTADWSRKLGPGAGPESSLSAEIELTPETLDAFGIRLGPGTVSGRTTARLTATLPGEGAAPFTLTSDLVGLGLSVDGLGWSKPRATPGRLSVTGVLGAAPRVEQLSLSAPGLDAAGRLRVAPDGALAAAEFDRVRVGGWLDAPVVLSGVGAARPLRAEIRGGTLDLRQRGDLGTSGNGGEVAVSLDRLILSDDLTLAPFAGQFSAAGGVSGQFDGRINGGAPVRGVLTPAAGGPAIRVQSDEGGRALADAGVLRGAEGGALDLTLTPLGGEGAYSGRMTLSRMRLTDAPAMASMLDSLSIIGLLDELEGPGLLFDTVETEFRMGGNRIVLDRAAAVGASLGISLDGTYDLAGKQMDMQGVISPIYIVNSIGSILTRPGEGLFGFTFTMRGPAGQPRVEVNPLSILTPGMFREIFRRPPPGQ